MRILVVDDESAAMRIIGRAVRKLAEPHDEVIQLMSYDFVERFFKDNPLPDLVFCDYEMPNHNGCEVIKLLRDMGFDGNSHFVTACDLDNEKHHCVDSVIHKPFKLELLSEAISNAR
jgi:CheY-like chemotaxis protein